MSYKPSRKPFAVEATGAVIQMTRRERISLTSQTNSTCSIVVVLADGVDGRSLSRRRAALPEGGHGVGPVMVPSFKRT
jgi:hypothetical protein